MRVNPEFVGDAQDAHRLIRAFPLAMVIARDAEAELAFVPTELRAGDGGLGTIVTHVAASDPVAETVRRGDRVRLVFSGPASYVTPGWYADPGLPTYNFCAVVVDGAAEVITDAGDVLAHLWTLTSGHEGARTDAAERWRPDAWARGRAEELLPDLVAFSVPIAGLSVKRKLGQNRTEADRSGTIDGLEASHHRDAALIAAMMREMRADERGNAR